MLLKSFKSHLTRPLREDHMLKAFVATKLSQFSGENENFSSDQQCFVCVCSIVGGEGCLTSKSKSL